MKISKGTLPAVFVQPVLADVPRLDPASLGDLAQAAEAALLRQGESANTLRSYRTALRYWAAWYALRYRQPIALPVPETAVLQFIVDHAQRPDEDGLLVSELPAAIDQALVTSGFKSKLGAPALNTLVHRVSVLSKVHQIEGVLNPCEQPRVRELLSKTRRGYVKRGALPQKKPALTREPLEALLETCDASLAGLRDRALLLFAFSSGGRRRSEVAQASLENTRRVGDAFIFTLSHSKTNQSGADRAENDKPIAGRAAMALTGWLAASKIKAGPIFRRVRRGGVIGEPLCPAAVRDIVKKRCLLAGIDEGFSAHSLRSGFVTEAGRQQIPLGETEHDHRSRCRQGPNRSSSAMGRRRSPSGTLNKRPLWESLFSTKIRDRASVPCPAARPEVPHAAAAYRS